MISRRIVWAGMAMLPAFAVVGEAAANECAAFTKERQAAISPADALRRLQEGNERFRTGKPENCNRLAQAQATVARQAPFAAVVGCIDSRVPPELVFDQGIGDIFTARVAGNFVNVDIMGSLEFAARVEGIKAIVVLGHTDCGAIKGALDGGAAPENLTQMLAQFRPAIEAARSVPGERSSKNAALMQAVTELNVKLATAMLIERSPALREMVAQKELLIAGAIHDLATGKVTFGA